VTPVDARARQAAVDPAVSVCVSAPAGSGKTGLLVHRLLVLLARVESPERIVAITFTRKAAAEMRARVQEALEAAVCDAPASSPHERTLVEAAARVVARDRALGWGLLDNPSRLSIRTIDSFCGELTRQLPVLSGCGGPLGVSDDAGELCQLAVHRYLRRVIDGEECAARRDLQALLLHLDNRWDVAVELLDALLRRREQWQPMLGARGLGPDERPALEAAMASVIAYRIDRLREQLSPWLPRLERLLRWRRDQDPTQLSFDREASSAAAWRVLAELLLTRDGSWRRTVNKNNGFPAGKGEAAERKAEMIELLRELAAGSDETLRWAIADLRLLPEPAGKEAHWEVLAALTRVLPRVVAELLLLFRQRGEVDHAQVAMAALTALGDDDAPTDLAERLDHRIEHLLVDEFQDTSSLQFELIRRLTRGWAQHNEDKAAAPRTLLVVGDPMQSIYGFREANVGLFIRARDEGIGDLELLPLELTVNFRSSSTLVDWNNRRFAGAFPAIDDTEIGAVAFSPATAARPASEEAELRLFSGDAGAQAEVDALCEAIAARLADDPESSIAILGRSRNPLRPFLAALRERNIAYAARDFDPLIVRPLVQDLVTLTSVLLDADDRYAWLSLLRTPPLALDNAGLLAVARAAPTAARFLESPHDAMPPECREPLDHLRDVLRWAEHYRDRLALRVWIEEVWLRLGAAGALASAADMDDASRFFRLVEDLAQRHGALTRALLEEQVQSLYASPGPADCRVQVMTLHKAKGLEFDHVFIPALAAGTRNSESPLLIWNEVTLPDSPTSVLLDIRAPTGATDADRLYRFLKVQRDRKQALEATRLLYVGCTRAANSLWLSACLPWKEDRQEYGPPRATSLLAALWPQVEGEVSVAIAGGTPATAAATSAYRRLRTRGPLESLPPAAAQAGGVELIDNRRERAFGTAVHRALESLVYRRMLPDTCDDSLAALLRVALLEAGADRPGLDALCERGRVALDRALGDRWLRWALDPARALRRAEYPLTWAADEETRSLVLDYLFADESTGEHWIVDYKTAVPGATEDPDRFAAAQLARYAPQLAAYRSALLARGIGKVRCALYFPLLGRHFELAADFLPAP
jgi:ATP-dependent helicase/nuclease subunit A